jgi:hypothetical protein
MALNLLFVQEARCPPHLQRITPVDIPVPRFIADVTLTSQASLISPLLTHTTTAPFLPHALRAMRT